MTDIASGVLFLAYVAVTLAAMFGQRGAPDLRKVAVRRFLAFASLAIVVPGFAKVEAWPFSRWQLFAYRYRSPTEVIEVVGVDGQGLEYQIDRRVWEPLDSLELFVWIQKHWTGLDSGRQAAAGGFLLSLVNKGLDAASAGRTVGRFARYLGPASAPTHVVYTQIWSDGLTRPRDHFTAIRIFLESWDVEKRALDPVAWRRELVYEGPR